MLLYHWPTSEFWSPTTRSAWIHQMIRIHGRPRKEREIGVTKSREDLSQKKKPGSLFFWTRNMRGLHPYCNFIEVKKEPGSLHVHPAEYRSSIIVRTSIPTSISLFIFGQSLCNILILGLECQLLQVQHIVAVNVSEMKSVFGILARYCVAPFGFLARVHRDPCFPDSTCLARRANFTLLSGWVEVRLALPGEARLGCSKT